MKKWQIKIASYCKKYNIPLEYLSDVLYEPKVIPMIRGKAFEFSTLIILRKFLPSKVWKVIKVPMNAQQGIHDIDVAVVHKQTKKQIRIECKLAKKESFRVGRDKNVTISVKCMRSRTLGSAMVKSLAPRFGVSESQLSVHNDQYFPRDFDVVITSIGNVFYRTNPKTGIFEWMPTKEEIKFLKSLAPKKIKDLKGFAFNKLYLAKSTDLKISRKNGIKCTRKRCKQKDNCGFIPNYPKIKFPVGTKKPSNNWVPLDESEELFKTLIT